MKFFTKTIAFALLVGLLAGCNLPQKVELKEGDKSAVCKVGDELVFALKSNPTTGFDWSPKSYNTSMLKLEGRNFVLPENPAETAVKKIDSTFRGETLVGAGGVSEISFLAIGQGECEVVFKYERPWEGQSQNEAKFNVKVLEK